MTNQVNGGDGRDMGNRVELAYGRTGLLVDLPVDCRATVVRKPPIAISSDSATLIQHALANPVGCKPLERLAVGARSACILICDITRPVPNGLFLRKLIESLMQAGIGADCITVLVATGLHRPNLDAELEEVLGDSWVQQHVRVDNHDARDEAAHVHLGRTRQHEVPVALNRTFVDADIKIATGLVEPHFMAGYSGGRKVIAPGVAHHETIRTFHSARFMESEFASSCNLAGNPLHETQLEIVEMLNGPVLSFNTVLDEHRNLAFASFGEVVASHMAAVAFARQSCEVVTGRKFKTVLTSSAGYPLDKTYYQTVKGMVTPLDILEEGGELIIASECSEGFGSAEFRDAQRRLVQLGTDGFLQSIAIKKLADIDEWQTEMQLKPMRIGRIHLYAPGLDSTDCADTGVEIVHDLSETVAQSIARQQDHDVAIIPEGPYVVPFAAQRG